MRLNKWEENKMLKKTQPNQTYIRSKWVQKKQTKLCNLFMTINVISNPLKLNQMRFEKFENERKKKKRWSKNALCDLNELYFIRL